MKEKLIELLKAAYDYGNELCSGREICLGCLYADDPYGCEYGAPADHLLANGVIVLPCKVGDTVWRVRPELCVYREKDACANYCEGFDTFCEEYEGGKWIERSRFCLSMLDDFGKTVFLTREEAEAALKGTVSTMETVEPREEPVLFRLLRRVRQGVQRDRAAE